MWWVWVCSSVCLQRRLCCTGEAAKGASAQIALSPPLVSRCVRSSFDFFAPRGWIPQVSYASLCMHSHDLEDTLGKKQTALEKIEHAVAQTHLDPPKVGAVPCSAPCA